MNYPWKTHTVGFQIGHAGATKLDHNQYDASTQADIHYGNLNHGPEDEIMGRLYGNEKRSEGANSKPVAHYSKQDILEQYCISEKGLGALENGGYSFFGCLSTRSNSSCSSRGPSSILTACMRQRVSSDENLYELYKRHPHDYAPFPKKQRYPWSPVSGDLYSQESSYFRRKPYTDPNRYTWMSSDDESVRMEKPKSIIDLSYRNPMVPPSKKHVSFARSYTLTSFDDAMSSLGSSSSHLNRITRSQERLLEVRKAERIQAITRQPEPTEPHILLDKIKRGPMKTQATQTEGGLAKKLLPNVHLSPKTIQRVKMVSQAAQTNGLNGRKLIKSLSEAGSKSVTSNKAEGLFLNAIEHEPLHRTQSDEPPRSPFIDSVPITIPQVQEDQAQSESSSVSRSEDHGSEDSVDAKKEIFIDFKPQVPSCTGTNVKKPLLKTFSDGVILVEKRKTRNSDDGVVPSIRNFSSLSHEAIQVVEESITKFVPRFRKEPIKNEGICKPLEDNIYSSIDESLPPQDSVDEEFHENIFYNNKYDRPSILEPNLGLINETLTPLVDESVVPSIYLRTAEMALSPFASSDSLANDLRDHSDNIWNESQATVLQVESGNENSIILNSPEIIASSSASLLTPSSRRKHLLMLQHQQRSSFDTEALDEELVVQSDLNLLSPNVLTKVSAKQVGLKVSQQRTLSPLRRRKMSESPPGLVESPLPAVVPDLLLARTDSCKTNTDLSESTTTDDYITANSGTDSSRKSASFQGFENHFRKSHGIYPAPSLKSASEIRLRPQDAALSIDVSKDSLKPSGMDDMVVPSISPSLSIESRYPEEQIASPYSQTLVPQICTGRSTPSEDSSSCGSYSVGGSTPDLLERYSVPSGSKPWSDDEERSVHYSSSGYYESPADESLPKRDEYSGAKKKKDFYLDLTNNAKHNNKTKHKHPDKNKVSSPKEGLKLTNEKTKRSKARTRSPLQNHKKGRKSPHKEKMAYNEERSYKATSDESSTGREYTLSQTSPRKTKKSKDNVRRKSLPRSPVSQKNQKKIDHEDSQPSSLPGSLSRRRLSKTPAITQPDLNAYSKASDAQKSSTPSGKETTTLKALSAESLRSVSPGSDSVFYSDPSSLTAEHQVHCLHCGKEVDIHGDVAEVTCNGQPAVIVQPPAGFEDSPKMKGGRLFKKVDKRLRSEEKGLNEQKRHRYRPDTRAKSEERGEGRPTLRGRLRPMQRSPFCSREQLKAADSSPSILPGAPDENTDQGLYVGCYRPGTWICIGDTTSGLLSATTDVETFRRDTESGTESEIEFCKRYQSLAHRVIHRKPYVDMYKRLYSESFDNGLPEGEETKINIKETLEEILKLMLTIWCRENNALRLVCNKIDECDKTVVVQRDSGEFGFRIHGSKPVVVTAIESGTPAESSGLEVGDIIITVNGINVLDRSHSDVVQIAHAGSDTLTLEIARTSHAINLGKQQFDICPIYSGYLWKLSGYAKGSATNKWVRRWFCLAKDNCLYCYKTDCDKQPVGAVMLFGQEVLELTNDFEPNKPNKFVIQKDDSVPLYLAADSIDEKNRWVEIINTYLNDHQAVKNYLEETKRNSSLPAATIDDPDCFGYLIKLGTQWKSWSRRYCVLKDAALYFYHDSSSSNAFGVALLHGYKVQQSSSSKKHAFEILPPDPSKKHYYFHAESDIDRRRWIASLEYSIDRWICHN